MALVRLWWDEISAIKEAIANNQSDIARGVFNDLPEDVRIGLWRATSKGGVWTVQERKELKPNSRTDSAEKPAS